MIQYHRAWRIDNVYLATVDLPLTGKRARGAIAVGQL